MIEKYSNQWFCVVKEGDFHFIKEFGSENGAVVIVELDDSYVFVRVPRAAHGFSVEIEAPRGYGKNFESSCQTAIRELYEETGYLIKPSQLEKLGSIKPNSAILASQVDVFFAKVVGNQKVKSHDSEVQGVFEIPKAELKSMITNGVITDSFTLSAFALLWSRCS